MNLTLRAIAEVARDHMGPTYFVIQRANGHWSSAAKIISVCPTEDGAEEYASAEKRKHPQQHFGVAVLRSEAREVAQPIEIVRIPENTTQEAH